MTDITSAIGSAGVTLSMTAAPAVAASLAEFEALTFVAVAEVVTYGEFGPSSQLVAFNPTRNRKTFKFRGAGNDGALELGLAWAPTNEGQDLLAAAADDETGKYGFRMEFPDTGDGSPTTLYFRGLVMSFTDRPDEVNSIVDAAAMVEIDGGIVEATAGLYDLRILDDGDLRILDDSDFRRA